MRLGWLTAWWHQIRRRPDPDPWNDDPEIVAERRRQHREGITDAATAFRARQQMRERRVDMQTRAWQRDDA